MTIEEIDRMSDAELERALEIDGLEDQDLLEAELFGGLDDTKPEPRAGSMRVEQAGPGVRAQEPPKDS